jgi:methylenetetrahydrofolate reductase (NADPH)
VDLGAEYIITNYCYDNRFFFDFVERCQVLNIHVPILPGVMPIYSVKMMEILAEICGATIPGELRKGIEALPEGDREALVTFGIDFAIGQCRELLKAGMPGIHIYSMDRSESAVPIVRALKKEGLL